MASFHFEKNLPHQENAVNAVVSVFDELETVFSSTQCVNPAFQHGFSYEKNIQKIRTQNEIKEGEMDAKSNILDIMMETGTGKTYTYTKTLFELNKRYGIFKFVIVVPTLPIKAGTIDFLKSHSTREHFVQQYGKTLKIHIVESGKHSKAKKSPFPSSVKNFAESGNFEKNHIQVLIINAGMINSETMQKSFDATLFDAFSVPFDAIAHTKPFVIIDEPHKFDNKNKTWENLQKMKPQYIVRYGATFPEKETLYSEKNILTGKTEKTKKKEKDYHNLIYTLSAVDSFHQNLVKGVIGHSTEFENGKNAIVKCIDSDGTEARFELIENENKKVFTLTKKENFEKIHPAMNGLFLENLNKSAVLLSNGLELKKGDKINPYSYSETLQETMIANAIQKHFELEKQLLTREIKIKPLTLFFIDNIEEYRNEKGTIREIVEQCIKAEVEKLLLTEENIFYREYLHKTLENISKTHGGYFSKDNSDKDEAVEQEIHEILHDKQTMLSLQNPRRFIFYIWTLREGWDNPNVFGICKIRSSGSDILKLQEVGRGLRLPVNEYGNRVKDEQFYLNYFVDFTENNFIESLKDEINKKSGAISKEEIYTQLTTKLITQILEKYSHHFASEENLLEILDEKGIIKRNNDFKEGGYEYIKTHFPLIFEGIDSNKIRTVSQQKKKITIRSEKYSLLKDLWEKLNQKVILEYKIENEEKFEQLFVDFLEGKNDLGKNGVVNKQSKIDIQDQQAIVRIEETALSSHELKKISTMAYDDFLKQLAKSLHINIKTLHSAFQKTAKNSSFFVNDFLSLATIRKMKEKFEKYLMYNALSTFEIGYQSIKSSIHPTKLTNAKGEVLKELSDSGIFCDEKISAKYLCDAFFYDSDLEKENIQTTISEVVVFSKIPKNSIKIPIAGGKTYSPDFAYVLNFEDGKQKMYFVVETKNADEESLREEEKQKILHAEKFFGDAVKIRFETQFEGKKMRDLIEKVYTN